MLACALPQGARAQSQPSASAAAQVPALTPQHWQQLARTDILAIRRAIESAHPGAIDAENPRFRDWLSFGAATALAQVDRVRSYDDMLSAVSFYAVGFQDGHLGYVDEARQVAGEARRARSVVVNGWHASPRGQAIVVDAVAPDWPVPLPPLGAALLSCDGRPTARLLDEDIAPFTGAPHGAAGRVAHASRLMHPPFADQRWSRCRFGAQDRQLDLLQHWAEVPADLFRRLKQGGRRTAPPPENGIQRLPDGTLWIRTANFQPSPAQNAALEQLLAALAAEPAAPRVVFDARGNNGGNSGIGQRLFAAATGGLDIDPALLDGLPLTQAWWRVSDIAVASLAWRDAWFEKRGDEETRRLTRQLLAAMKAAQARGEDWVLQPGGAAPRIARDDPRARHAKLRRPVGSVALLTDEFCASACLDFADLVRAVPGSIHLGRTTSADTIYIDIGSVKLPSGNTLIVPLKVWRNRLRANNEALVPDVPLTVDLSDDSATREAVLAALAAAPGHRDIEASGIGRQ